MAVTAEAEGNSSFCLPTKYAGRNKQTNKQCGVRQETGRDGTGREVEGVGGQDASRNPSGAPCQPVHLKLMPQQTLSLMQSPNEFEVGVGKKTGRHK